MHFPFLLTNWKRFGLVALEVKEGDLVSDRRHNSIPVRGEDEVPGAIHRPVQVRELERKLHSCSENR